MQTDEREVISFESAKRELEKQCKDLLHTANVFLIVGLLMGAMMQFFISAIGGDFWAVIIWIIVLFPCTCFYVGYLHYKYIVKHEYFGIVTDTLEKIERDKVNWLARREGTRDVFHFKRCGKFVIYTHNTMPYATEGDTYYLLIVQTNKIPSKVSFKCEFIQKSYCVGFSPCFSKLCSQINRMP